MNNWVKPRRLDSAQGYLFKTATEEVLASLRISHDEAKRWLEKGWLSFATCDVSELDPPREAELQFIASLSRSGLSDSLISELLRQLQSPFLYDPNAIAYSFTQGWVSSPQPPDPFEVVDANIEDWLASLSETGETGRLQQLQDRICQLIEDSSDDDDE